MKVLVFNTHPQLLAWHVHYSISGVSCGLMYTKMIFKNISVRTVNYLKTAIEIQTEHCPVNGALDGAQSQELLEKWLARVL